MIKKKKLDENKLNQMHMYFLNMVLKPGLKRKHSRVTH